MVSAIIYTIGGVIDAVIGLRFILRLVGANPGTEFVRLIYDWSTPLVAPFAGVFGQDPIIAGHGAVVVSVFDWTALLALVVYGIVFALIGGLVARSGA